MKNASQEEFPQFAVAHTCPPRTHTFVVRELVPQRPQQRHARGVGVAEQRVHVRQQRVAPADGIAQVCGVGLAQEPRFPARGLKVRMAAEEGVKHGQLQRRGGARGERGDAGHGGRV